MLESLIPSRTVEDYVDGRVPIVLADRLYRLRELSMADTDEWATSIDGRLVGLLEKVDALDSGEATLASLFEDARLFDASLFDTLLAYDRDGVLPGKDELVQTVTHTQVLFALLGVWSTTKSPLAAGVMNAVKLALILTGNAPRPTSSSPETSSGDLLTSAADSPTDSSTTTSAPPRKRSSSPAARTSRRPSKPSGSATSRRTTTSSTGTGSEHRLVPMTALSASPAKPSSKP